MMRDVPKIYLIFFTFAILLMILTVSYATGFIRGGDTLSLNDIVLTSAVSEIDEMSRLKKGTLVLKDTFETKAWEGLVEKYPEGSKLEFVYLFDNDDDFYNKPVPEQAKSDLYEIGGSQIPEESSTVFKDLPVKAVRLRVKKAGDKAIEDMENGPEWTYTSTIKLDVAND